MKITTWNLLFTFLQGDSNCSYLIYWSSLYRKKTRWKYILYITRLLYSTDRPRYHLPIATYKNAACLTPVAYYSAPPAYYERPVSLRSVLDIPHCFLSSSAHKPVKNVDGWHGSRVRRSWVTKATQVNTGPAHLPWWSWLCEQLWSL